MIPILMYHQVAEIPRKLDPGGLAVPPGQFEQQMSYLARKAYLCLTLPEALRHLRKGGRAPAKSFVLTFDDGYQNVHSRACPILERFGFTATVFLVAGRMGSPSNWAGQEGARSGLLLSWAEARDLARRGFVLGSHTLSHPRLSLLDGQSAFEEIRNSRVLLQDRLDIQVDFFSYPYSDSDARVERLVESAGYTAACAGDSGPWSVFHLWRTPCLRDDTTLSFALKAGGWYNRRIALRESAPGRLLRRGVRMFRRRPTIRHIRRPDVLNHDLGREPERGP
jgi:peptidoglycan/xylan/chitin deacetylase (PgdA/CDA1 family)